MTTFDPSPGLGAKLKALAEAGELQADPAQMTVAARLDKILAALGDSRAAAKSSALGWLFGKRKREKPPRGLYVHGSVGRGKTMLMDMFFAMAPVERKRRAHFHEFMADVHARIHAHRLKLKAGETKQADPVPPVAAALYAEAELLCFDEFTVTDIADAMILARLFGELFSLGCVLVATSNVEPDNLYRDGLNRGLFLPFVKLLKEHVDVVSLDSPTDYRMEKLDALPVYLTPLNAETDAAMDRAWATATEGHRIASTEIDRMGRSIAVKRAAGRAARFTFAELCEQPLGAADYLALVERFDVLFLDRIPLLSPERRNETKRFIILVDALYDARARLIASAAAMPEELLTERRGTEGFEFDRTISRLFEMRSGEYQRQHLEAIAEM